MEGFKQIRRYFVIEMMVIFMLTSSRWLVPLFASEFSISIWKGNISFFNQTALRLEVLYTEHGYDVAINLFSHYIDCVYLSKIFFKNLQNHRTIIIAHIIKYSQNCELVVARRFIHFQSVHNFCFNCIPCFWENKSIDHPSLSQSPKYANFIGKQRESVRE